MKQIVDFEEFIESLPILREEDLRKPRNVRAVCSAEFEMKYPLTKVDEPQIGYVFGTNRARDLIYFSRYSQKIDNERVLTPTHADPGLDRRFVKTGKIHEYFASSTL